MVKEEQLSGLENTLREVNDGLLNSHIRVDFKFPQSIAFQAQSGLRLNDQFILMQNLSN